MLGPHQHVGSRPEQAVAAVARIRARSFLFAAIWPESDSMQHPPDKATDHAAGKCHYEVDRASGGQPRAEGIPGSKQLQANGPCRKPAA